jgi:hypothetical protein
MCFRYSILCIPIPGSSSLSAGSESSRNDRSELMARRLAEILAAGVVGHSRFMAVDEASTHERLKALSQDFIEPIIAKHPAWSPSSWAPLRVRSRPARRHWLRRADIGAADDPLLRYHSCDAQPRRYAIAPGAGSHGLWTTREGAPRVFFCDGEAFERALSAAGRRLGGRRRGRTSARGCGRCEKNQGGVWPHGT